MCDYRVIINIDPIKQVHYTWSWVSGHYRRHRRRCSPFIILVVGLLCPLLWQYFSIYALAVLLVPCLLACQLVVRFFLAPLFLFFFHSSILCWFGTEHTEHKTLIMYNILCAYTTTRSKHCTFISTYKLLQVRVVVFCGMRKKRAQYFFPISFFFFLFF